MIAIRRTLPLLVPATALALAACGGGSGSSTSSASAAPYDSGGGSPAAVTAAAHVVKLRADPSGALRFTARRLTVRHGTVTLRMSNPSSSGLPHGIAIEGKGVDKDGKVVSPGGTSKVTVRLKPGRYEFYCPVPAHKAAGMKGTLVVK